MTIQASMSCSSCEHWMPIKERCVQERTAGWYKGKNFCRHWKLSPKWRIMQEKTQEQVNVSRWNGSNIINRRLEVL